jgi:NADH-quinone oxidoreductase subunit L
MHTNNIWEMGGLHKKMPITSITFLIAAFAISGIFPLSGFWSKDEILVNVYESGNKILYYAAVITAFLTAFYMFRLYFVTFTGNLKDERAHESPAVMTVPLILLALLSIISGFVGIPGTEKSIYNFLYTGEHPHEVAMNLKIAISSNIVALSGILFAFLIYGLKLIKAETMKKITGPFYVISKNKYFIDEIYLFLIRKIFFAITEFVKWFDRHIVDGAVNLVAFLCRWAGAKLRLTINGNVQSYALIIFSGMILIIAVFAIYNPEALRIFGGR